MPLAQSKIWRCHGEHGILQASAPLGPRNLGEAIDLVSGSHKAERGRSEQRCMTV